jgi:hypothetical protein
MPNPRFLNLKNYSLSALAVGLACTLGGHTALANPGDFYTPPATASDPAVAGSNVSRMTALTGTNSFDCRTSTFPGDNRLAEMPNSTLAFHQAGSTPTSVLVTFVGSWSTPTASNGKLPAGSTAAGANIFLTIDDQRVDEVSNNGGTLVHDGSAPFSNGTRSFTFVTEPISPGDHQVKFLWSNNLLNGTGTICVFERTIVVQHK